MENNDDDVISWSDVINWSGEISWSEESSDTEAEVVAILRYLLRSGQVRIAELDNVEDSDDEIVLANIPWRPYTEILDKTEFSTFTKQSAGLIKKCVEPRPNSIAALVSARQRGLYGSTSFTKADRCKISNNFLPNKSTVVASYPTKIFCGIYLNNGNTFLSASQDKFIRLFDTSKGNFKLIKTILARDVGWSILDVAISPDGNYLAYSSWCESLQLCKIWDNSENQDALLLCLDERKFCIFSLKFSANGKEILCGANDGYIYVYDREYNKRALRIVGHDDDVNSVAFADERCQIIYTGGDDGICKVWDRRSLTESDPKPVGCLAGHMLGITFVEPRGDGRHLITNSKDQSIKLWDVRRFSSNNSVRNTKRAVTNLEWDYRWRKIPETLKHPYKPLQGDTSIMTFCGHSVLQTLCRCHFSPLETTGQRYIYTGCADGKVIVYDVLTGKVEKELTGHRACVRDVSWHPHKSELMSSSWDGKIIRWTYQENSWLDSDDEDGAEGVAGGAGRKRSREEPLRRSQRIADKKSQNGRKD